MSHTAEHPMRVAVLASGGGTNLQALLDACGAESPARVVLVASDKPDAGALDRARAAGVETYHIPDPADGGSLERVLRQRRVDLVVLAGYLKLVPATVVAAFGGPGMYGRRVHRAVLDAGATVSGASVHLVNAEYDRGPIVAQWPVPVRPGDTPETLAARVLAVEHRLLPAVVLAAAAAGRVVSLRPGRDFGLPELGPG